MTPNTPHSSWMLISIPPALKLAPARALPYSLFFSFAANINSRNSGCARLGRAQTRAPPVFVPVFQCPPALRCRGNRRSWQKAGPRTLLRSAFLLRREYKFPKQRMCPVGPAFQLRVELDAYKPGMGGQLYYLHQPAVRRQTRQAQPSLGQPLAIFVVEHIAVPVPLRRCV